MSKKSSYCMLDVTSINPMCENKSDTGNYSDEINSINDVIPCTNNTPSVYSTRNANNIANSNWNCTDRGSCAMGDGSYKK